MKVCAILARGLDADSVSRHRFKIMITGQHSNGKSAVADGLVAALAEGHQSDKLPTTSLLEEFSGQARISGGVTRPFHIAGRACLVTMAHYLCENDMYLMRYGASSPQNYESRGGLDIVTLWRHNFFKHGAMSIHFDGAPLTDGKNDWSRVWEIAVLQESLKTPAMMQALEDLRDFHARRQARVLSWLNEAPFVERG